MKTLGLNTSAPEPTGIRAWQDGDVFRESNHDLIAQDIADALGWAKGAIQVRIAPADDITFTGTNEFTGAVSFTGAVVFDDVANAPTEFATGILVSALGLSVAAGGFAVASGSPSMAAPAPRAYSTRCNRSGRPTASPPSMAARSCRSSASTRPARSRDRC